jgi:hypothetical protein
MTTEPKAGKTIKTEKIVRRALGALQQPVEDLMDVRKRWLDFAAKQNTDLVNALQRGLGVSESSPAARLADLQRQSVDNYVEVQKRWLDLADQLLFPQRAEKTGAGEKNIDHVEMRDAGATCNLQSLISATRRQR